VDKGTLFCGAKPLLRYLSHRIPPHIASERGKRCVDKAGKRWTSDLGDLPHNRRKAGMWENLERHLPDAWMKWVARQVRPELVLMDIYMPGMDGIEAAEILTLEKIAPIVLLTAFSAQAKLEGAEKVGVMNYLVRP
jgi:CheY-like chemotaxis protein